MTNTIQRLQAWFSQNCDGDWEHTLGVSIQSCDNPGWWVKIDVRGTALEHKPYDDVQFEHFPTKSNHSAEAD
ncbi:MAG: immunity 53 family protein [Alphaproteobacteria bacterium]|nr:immunity 53 family protein [Alphaproteobacteria bacterium]